MSADGQLDHYVENKIVDDSPVARLLNEAIDSCLKTQAQIAREVGFDRQNMVSMIKQGHTKLPIYKVKLIADCLKLDAKELLDRCMKEYRPRDWEVIKDVYGI